MSMMHTKPRGGYRRAAAGQGNPWLKPGSIIAIVILAVAFLAALFPGLFTSADLYAGTDVALLAPGENGHFMGTDAVGRDLYARVVYGARQSLLGALIAVVVGLVVGTLIGLVAGSLRGVVDTILMRVVDVLLSIPGILLSLSIIIVLGFGSVQAAVAVGATSVATFARLARSQVITVANAEYIEAAFGAGATRTTVLLRHLLPNSLTPVIALATLQFGTAILQLSILGFLGYGAPPPTPEWGLIIAEGRDFMATAWWLIILPGIALVAVVMSANRLSQNFPVEA
ncbi:ABC transporter permease [Corynebacterium minutissimum]|uniref:ABC transporter permease n=1 Tax=Corynebacterium minutissimum TaxID=38301 RepID=A0A2X4RAB7_9CORY|nr:ABC transporter permease [Corynebacterium minutissimum]KHO28894.1 peptide ABC transporter permease [Corynebacterium minutissimum]QPS59533.1 ABC transporter permease [Corynebacterium minutissimum]QQA79677.1 ABC transporter permease [Corynebacterium minutissimum]SQH98891.1 ABC transporter permease [Corynebacterium minutissimum]VEG06688.1 ABC transporter permease [Corynebacterium minutissimum]